MKLIVNGEKRTLPESTVRMLEAQFVELAKKFDGREKIPDWMDGFNGNEYGIRVALRQANLGSLSTDVGMAFLKSKFPCPNSMGRDY